MNKVEDLLNPHQKEAINQMKNGSVLCGGVGSGKSRTALAYYIEKVCRGGKGFEPIFPKDLYIITTAKKRDSKDWEYEASYFYLSKNRDESYGKMRVVVDSWNNIKKYKSIYGAFFIFDEQRLVGNGVWVKTFLDIARKNQWILLSATPGDQWSDYIPIFVANGFYKNKTEFSNKHCVYSRFSKYPKIERYVGTKELERNRDAILIPLYDDRETIRHYESCIAEYDMNLYRTIMKDRWDPYENCPIEETGKLVYLLRRAANEHESRIEILDGILKDRHRCLVFYNFDYELEMLRSYANQNKVLYAELNGHKHEELPIGERWLYLIQYASGCEGWNCVTTDTTVFFSQNYSYRVLEQASGRIDRMNTPYKDLYYYQIRSRAPIDSAIWQKLKNKKSFNEGMFARRIVKC